MKRILAISLAINIMAAGLAGAFIYRKGGLSYFSQKTAITSVETGNYANCRSVFQVSATRADICFVGDSIVNQCRWSEFLGVPVANRGISGDRTDGLLSRLDTIVAVDPTKIFLMIGINDIQARRPIDSIVKDFTRCITELSARLPRATIYAHSVLPVNNDLFFKVHGRTLDNAKVFELNERIKALSGVQYVDLSALRNGHSLSEDFTHDGIHLNGAGYKKWIEVIAPYLAP